ncbi:MAG: sporulation transcription factor Spo0A, partial [Clostridia bacterium]|nr:sporulation transcription factor Spo0A [Clostridia bacterium]
IVILERDEEFLENLRASFEEQSDFTVCGVSGSGSVGLGLINQYKPDVVLLDTVLSGEDGFGVMKHIKEYLPTCSVFVVSGFTDDKLVSKAIARGAKYYFVKPVTAATVCDRVKDVLEEQSTEYMVATQSRDKRRVTSLDEKISNIFISIGIPPHIMGYQYLREGIKMTISDPSIINNVTKRLYPEIGEKYNTTASKVDRAIRHAIEVAWNRGRIDAVNSIFGVRVYMGNDRPTNSEFIALIADKLIFEGLN